MTLLIQILSSCLILLGLTLSVAEASLEFVGEYGRGEWTVMAVTGVSRLLYYLSFFIWTLAVNKLNIFLSFQQKFITVFPNRLLQSIYFS